MQVLWSRAAQTRSCRCPPCLHAAKAIARRTTTSPGRTRLKVGDIFTACYSAILATAALADAKVKEDRRKDWDRAIEEARSGTQMEKLHGRLDAGTPMGDLPIEEKATRLASPGWYDVPAVLNVAHWTASSVMREVPLATRLRRLDLHLQESLELHKELPVQAEMHQPDLIKVGGAGLAEDGPDSMSSSREPLRRLHLDKLEEMIANLVSRLLHGTRALAVLGDIRAGNSEFFSTSPLQETVERIRELHSRETRPPHYSWVSDEGVWQERAELHRSISALAEAAQHNGDIDLMLAKICYNLLVSSAPPSITTYNLLINSLTLLRRHDLGQVVVDSFIHDSKFRPNAGTVRLFLEHYTAKNDPIGFRGFVSRMRAVDGDTRSKKHALVHLVRPEIQSWALSNKTIRRGGCLSQKTHRTAEIFEALILGSLKMTSLTSAIRYLRAALREGKQVSSEIVFDVIQTCVTRMDCSAAKSLLNLILSRWKSSEIFPDIVYNGKVRYTIYHLLRLCGIDPSLEYKQELPENSHRFALGSMLRYLRLESINEIIDQFAGRLHDLDEALGIALCREDSILQSNENDLYPGGFLGFKVPALPKSGPEGVERACKILETASKFDRSRIAKKRQSLKQARQTEIRICERKLANATDKIHASRKDLCLILFQGLSPRQRRNYRNILREEKESHSMTTRLEFLLLFYRVSITVPGDEDSSGLAPIQQNSTPTKPLPVALSVDAGLEGSNSVVTKWDENRTYRIPGIVLSKEEQLPNALPQMSTQPRHHFGAEQETPLEARQYPMSQQPKDVRPERTSEIPQNLVTSMLRPQETRLPSARLQTQSCTSRLPRHSRNPMPMLSLAPGNIGTEHECAAQ